MRISVVKPNQRRGFTLVELTTGLMMAMAVAGALISLVSHQVTLTRLMNAQSFLRDEAPQINLLLSQIFESSTSYRIYPSRPDAIGGTGAVNTGGTAVRLSFIQPDGAVQQSVICFEKVDGADQLNFYNLNGGSSWTISEQPTAVTFANDTGVLLVTMNGPNQEEITYVGK